MHFPSGVASATTSGAFGSGRTPEVGTPGSKNGMHAPRLRELVAELFESHGFDVTVDAALEGRSGNYYTAPVLAEQTDYAVLIERRGQQETVTARDVAELANVVEDVGAEQGLLVHLGPLDDAARGAGAGRVILWDAITLTNLLGNARLAGATGYPLVRLPLEADVPVLESPTQVVGDDVLPAAFTDDSAFSIFDGPLVAEPQSNFEPDEDLVHFGNDGLAGGIDFDALESLSAPTAPPAAPATAPAAPATATPTTLPVLPPRITAEEAAASVRDKLYLVESHELVLQPIHVLDYECDLLVEGSLRYDTVRGRIEVHGTRKDVREVDGQLIEPRIAGAAPAGVHLNERTLRVSHERSIELSRDAIMAAHTRLVEIETSDESEDVCVTERKQVAPRPDHVRIQHLGTVHRPQWRLAGPNGTLLVDAVTGERVDEELRHADPGVVMLD